VEAILAMLPIAVARYREMVKNLGNSPTDIEQAREVIRETTDQIPMRPGADGVPIAELSLNESMPLGQLAVGSIQVGLVAGA